MRVLEVMLVAISRTSAALRDVNEPLFFFCLLGDRVSVLPDLLVPSTACALTGIVCLPFESDRRLFGFRPRPSPHSLSLSNPTSESATSVSVPTSTLVPFSQTAKAADLPSDKPKYRTRLIGSLGINDPLNPKPPCFETVPESVQRPIEPEQRGLPLFARPDSS